MDTTRQFFQDYVNDGRSASPLQRMVCGATAAIIAQTCTYPLDIVRRRMQSEGLGNHGNRRYRSILGVEIVETWKLDVPSDREGRGSAEIVEGSDDELDQGADLDGDQLCVLWGDRALVWSEEAAELRRGGFGFVWIVCLFERRGEEEEMRE